MSALRRVRLQGVLRKSIVTRLSKDEIKHGRVWNGYDYSLQVWVVDGVIQDCGHPEEMKAKGCCNTHKLTGRKILDIAEAEAREELTLRQLREKLAQWNADQQDKTTSLFELLTIAIHQVARKSRSADPKQEETMEAIGNTIIALADYCTKKGWDLQDIVKTAWTRFRVGY